jgi:MerR family transcriptional regulator/heat shock protein HspR
MRKAQGLYIISVAAQILEMHPQTLRKYERAGFVEPPRMGTLRLYSEEDIARLRLIKYLVDELGLNLSGVELALELTNKLLDLRSRLQAGRTANDGVIDDVDDMLLKLGLRVEDRDNGRQEPDRPQRASGRGTVNRES